MELHHVRLSDPTVAPLLAGLDEEYRSRYGSNDELGRTQVSDFDPPEGTFVVLLDRKVTAAGGGFRAHTGDVCEIKRMWTNPAYRRRGLGARVLDALEEAARAAGYNRLILETGPRQPEAAALYQQRGYMSIPPYGHYPEALAFAVDVQRRSTPTSPEP
jgi:GNAT superfamily N-acetyltransferase